MNRLPYEHTHPTDGCPCDACESARRRGVVEPWSGGPGGDDMEEYWRASEEFKAETGDCPEKCDPEGSAMCETSIGGKRYVDLEDRKHPEPAGGSRCP